MIAAKRDYELKPGRLWPDTPSGNALEIEVFGATGEFKSGKTILGLSIAPGRHPEGHEFAGKPRTLYLDFEKSGGCYGGTGCQRLDVPAKMLELRGGSYTPLDIFKWFLELVEHKLKPGQFDVVAVDPITDIESGLVDYVKANCEKFGLTKNQVEKGGGLLWGAVKDFWKQVLLKVGAKCKCFFFTSHLRDSWSGNTPTGKREPKGKETLLELASLYLWLERKPDDKGNVPGKPSAIVLKERLADTFMDEAGNLQIVHLLPPRLPVATVDAIRGYIAAPPDYQKLKAGERVEEEKLSDETRLRLEAAKAEAERDAEQARLQRMERMEAIRGNQTQQAAAPGPAKATDKTAEVQAAKTETKAADAEAEKVAADMQAKIEEGNRLAEKAPPEHQQIGRGNPDAGSRPDENGKATIAQVADIKKLCEACSVDGPKLKAMLARVNAAKVSDLSYKHAELLVKKLEEQAAKVEVAGVPY